MVADRYNTANHCAQALDKIMQLPQCSFVWWRRLTPYEQACICAAHHDPEEGRLDVAGVAYDIQRLSTDWVLSKS